MTWDREKQKRTQAGVQDAFEPRYNATEDLPLELQRLIQSPIGSPQRDIQLDQAYDQYAEQSPIMGNFDKLKRYLGSNLLNAGKQK